MSVLPPSRYLDESACESCPLCAQPDWTSAVQRTPQPGNFFRDYGLHPGIPNNGEDNFLLAHLFVGAAHSDVR